LLLLQNRATMLAEFACVRYAYLQFVMHCSAI